MSRLHHRNCAEERVRPPPPPPQLAFGVRFGSAKEMWDRGPRPLSHILSAFSPGLSAFFVQPGRA